MTGEEALANFKAAAKCVERGDFEAARALYPTLLQSDRIVIEDRIAKAKAE